MHMLYACAIKKYMHNAQESIFIIQGVLKKIGKWK